MPARLSREAARCLTLPPALAAAAVTHLPLGTGLSEQPARCLGWRGVGVLGSPAVKMLAAPKPRWPPAPVPPTPTPPAAPRPLQIRRPRPRGEGHSGNLICCQTHLWVFYPVGVEELREE